MENTVGINQPYYLPYIGFFDRAKACDWFVINEYSPLNRTRANHRRARIIQIHPTAPQDFIFLTQTIPPRYEGVPFDQIPLSDQFWETQKQHAQTLYGTYKSSKGFFYSEGLLSLLEERGALSLGEYNTILILYIAKRLGLDQIKAIRELSISYNENMDTTSANHATAANLAICNSLRATRHIAGQNAPLWLDEELFNLSGIEVHYQKIDFKPYRQYNRRQLFTDGLSTVDLLFNAGENAASFIGQSSVIVDKETLLATTELTGR
ncbi:MAG: WbqC family protein [bacterium]|nr:WbqC family protein [bacterium]